MKSRLIREFKLALTTVFFAMLLTSPPASADDSDSLYSLTRGGRLYDNWYAELKDRAPEIVHPAYPKDGPSAGDIAATWRCSECHGWDYKGDKGTYASGAHATGIKGIRDMRGADLETIVAVLKDETHAYAGAKDGANEFGPLMDDSDFRDLALFVSKGQVDMDFYIHRQTREAKGHKSLRQNYFKSICAACHGLAGNELRNVPPLSDIAMKRPWMSLHKMLNGHPGEQMPTLRMLDPQILVDILAYVQSMGQGEITYSIVRGGRLYDNWRKVNKDFLVGNWSPEYAANKRHPAYPIDKEFAKSPRVNWRCKECHGWDYMGAEGAYGSGEHFTGIKGVQGMRDADPEAIIAILKDKNHRYDEVMEYQDFRDLANFVSKGQVDMDQYIDRKTGLLKGSKTENRGFFESICANCHGLDGRMIDTTPLREVVLRDPWHAFHKIINGHPDEAMPALRVFGIDVLMDILTYVQTLPPEP